MPDLRELYQEVILDHNKAPRNFGRPEAFDLTAEGFNPLCGDHYHIFLKVDDGVITGVAFDGSGCAISKASASMMTSILKGKTLEEAQRYFEQFHRMITGEQDFDRSVLGKLVVFSEVCNYPTRIKCAVLPWHTMHAALSGQTEAVSTE